MALYTVSGVIDVVKILIEEANDTNVITENELITLVSKAQQWVATESGCYTSWGTVTLDADTVQYTPPTGSSIVLALYYNYEDDLPGVGTRMLAKVDPEMVPHAPQDSVPLYWFHRGNKICIFPSMPVAPSNTSMNVLYSKIPDALTALTDDLTIPDEFQNVVPYRVAEQVAIKDNQLEKWQILSAKVNELVKQGIAQYASGTFTTAPAGPPAGGAG
jgi:hypothetical protein